MMRMALVLGTWFMLVLPGCSAGAERHFATMADAAVGDLLGHFWIGDARSGHIVNTWKGYATPPLPDERGALWERAMLYLTLDNWAQATNDPTMQQRLQADWNHTKSAYRPQQLKACGHDSGTNWAADDAGWSALMYLAAYRATHDPAALACSRGLVDAAFTRWMDDRLGGGMWYSDARQSKSLYAVALVLAALRLSELTGEQAFADRARRCYDWMESHLLRDDGLYWCDYELPGPKGANRPHDIHEASSVVFLGGAMGMGVIHARLFHTTGEDKYRQRALRTAEAVAQHLATTEGILLNDRDAWVNGIFAGDWVREVLSLPGMGPRHYALLARTAESIYANARTPAGYYGGSWSGPAEGECSRWFKIGSKPGQLMTSTNSVNLIIAAAQERRARSSR